MIQGRWYPQTEAEWQLLEDVHVVTRLAAQEGVPKARIASLLAFMASAASQQAAFEEMAPAAADDSSAASLSERMAEFESKEGATACPSCGEPIEDFTAGLGLTPLIAEPCRCELTDHDDAKDLYDEVCDDGDV